MYCVWDSLILQIHISSVLEKQHHLRNRQLLLVPFQKITSLALALGLWLLLLLPSLKKLIYVWASKSTSVELTLLFLPEGLMW